MANILIVEDEEVIHELIKRNLSLVGHICHSAFDGKEALECLADKRFDLMILDIMLPKEDGFSVMRQAKGQPTIFLTARDSLNDRMTGFSLGADDYIIKPFEFERFNLALNNYKSRYNLVEEQSILKQDELDKTIIYQDTDVEVTLPKGLDKNTLNTVWSEIIKIDGMFTTEEISAKVGISRVSIRKYLEFLKSLKLLSLDLHRGSVGRPVYKYKCIDKNANIIDLYIQ